MQIVNMIIGNLRTENSAWPKNIMFDIPQAPAAANKKQRKRLRKQREQLDAKKLPKGQEAAKEIVDDIFHHFTTKGLDKEVIDLLLQLSPPKPWKSPRGSFTLLKLTKPNVSNGLARNFLVTHI